MRCDDSPEGCSPCLQNQSECKTTDRISGRATVRGYVQCLERRIQQLEQNNREMEDHLISLGLDIKPSCGYADASSATIQEWNAAPGNATQLHWTNNGNDTTSATNGSSHRSSTDPTVDTPMIHLPSFRGGLAGNNYLGVSSGNSFVSSIRGTSLIVLGMEIDLTDYMSPDLDEPDPSTFLTKPVYNKSYSAFIQTANGGTPRIAKPELPPREEGLIYVQWFFRVINPYLPLLHKPSFISMVGVVSFFLQEFGADHL